MPVCEKALLNLAATESSGLDIIIILLLSIGAVYDLYILEFI